MLSTVRNAAPGLIQQMLHCHDYGIEQWKPAFEIQNEPVAWTRVRCGSVEICNSLEWVAWSQNPVQVRLCEVCGHSDCASGGYVHVTRMPNALLWTTPKIDKVDQWQDAQYGPSAAVRQWGSVVVPHVMWQRWRMVIPTLPSVKDFPEATRSELADAWRGEAKGEFATTPLDNWSSLLRQRIIATDHFDLDDVLTDLDRLIDWLLISPDEVVVKDFHPARQVSAVISTLYTEGPPEDDWPALARVGSQTCFAFGRDWIFPVVV
jgi:hypothetical protein